MSKAPALKVGDSVSVLTQAWGEAWAKSVHGDKEWKTGRTYGTVLRRDGSKWICDFAEKDGKHDAWDRKPLRFEKRAAAPAAAPAASGSGSKAAGKAPAAAWAPARADSDESDLDSSDDEMEQPDDGVIQSADGWERNDNVRTSQRAKDGIHDTANPILKLPVDSSLYQSQARVVTACSNMLTVLGRATACRSGRGLMGESPLPLGRAERVCKARS